jgi:SSS family solute:Na+ symporter
VLITWFAVRSDASIFEMVENAYKVTLVAAFVPLTAGIYWRHANRIGALSSMVAGIAVWLSLETLAPEGVCPPQLAGLLAAIVAMLLGSWWSRAAKC